MPSFKKITEMLIKRAKEKGASSVKLIQARDVFVEDYVRLKCQYGCKKFARYFTCPPYSPTSDETRKTLKNYSQGLLIEFSGLIDHDEQVKFHEGMSQLEREAFLNGLHKAFVYLSGPCQFCEICPAESIENRNEFSKKDYKNPLKARPSLEACEIDVFKMVRKAGFKIDVVKEGECYKIFGLLLLK